jgi:hypothetical protein
MSRSLHWPPVLSGMSACFDNPGDVADLLGVLRKAPAEDQVRTLIDKLPAEGHIGLF